MTASADGSRSLIDRAREICLEIAIALMLISGVTPLAGFDVGVEHMPYGIAVAVFLGRRPPTSFLIAVGAGALFWTLSHFYWGAWSEWTYLVQFINVLTPVIFFSALRDRLERTARIVFWAYIVFGLVQWFGLLERLEPLLDLFISRFRAARAPGYRGVQSLESEPARAGFQLIMLFIIGRNRFRNQTVAFAALVVCQTLLLRATIGFMLLAIFVLYLAIEWAIRKPKLAPVLLLGVLGVSAAAYAVNPKVEIIVDRTAADGVAGLEETLTVTSGGRYLALKDTIKDIATQPLGRGADPAFQGNELEVVQEERIDLGDGVEYQLERATRPVSAILNAMRTFGVAMAFLVAWAVRRDMFAGARPQLNATFWFVVTAALLYGPTGSEALLIALGFAGGAPPLDERHAEPAPVATKA